MIKTDLKTDLLKQSGETTIYLPKLSHESLSTLQGKGPVRLYIDFFADEISMNQNYWKPLEVKIKGKFIIKGVFE